MAETFSLKLRSIRTEQGGRQVRVIQDEKWDAKETAVIVCDVWDYHHCLNAVRRLEEFAPRLDAVLKAARSQGAVVIHSPSDCMPAYVDHPARQRAIKVPVAANLPQDVAHWCSRISQEDLAVYPIDQSDGGEDDDPAEHAEWAAKLKGMGRNPGMPWKKQSDLITIDPERDFISDRGDEVWNILEQRGIKNVILTGVHCNMCVLGRPFGLRQMVRNKKHVVLMRDMTDSMYSPKSWPFVDHFTGHDLVVAHVERRVCPTITSDQLLGGEPFRWKSDRREARDVMSVERKEPVDRAVFEKQWSVIELPSSLGPATNRVLRDYRGPIWYRSAVRLPEEWTAAGPVRVTLQSRDGLSVWLNGHKLDGHATAAVDQKASTISFALPTEHIAVNDYNLLVIHVEHRDADSSLTVAPILASPQKSLSLKGRWQVRIGADGSNSNIPLPAKFGIGSDVVFQP